MYINDSDIQNFPVGMAYVPMQKQEKRYSDDVALSRGTIYPELDLPFMKYENVSKMPQSALNEVMKLNFVCYDLGLYLDTHPDDKEAHEYYAQCVQKSMYAQKNYEEKYGPLFKVNSSFTDKNWIDDPWPWE